MGRELTTIDTKALSSILEASRNGLGVFTAPFSKEVLIFHDIMVAGTRNIFNIDEIVDELEIALRLRLLRDPKNLSSKWSVKVMDHKGREVGFLPADVNEPVARLMDVGKAMFAKVQSVEARGSWYQILLEIYLDD